MPKSERLMAFFCIAALVIGGCETTGGISGTPNDGVSVKNVKNIPDPCSEQVQRTEKFKRTAGSAAIGALACTGAALLFDSIKSGGSLKSDDYAKIALACGALGALYGYNKASDSLRRQCELHKIAQQKKLDTNYELVTLSRPVVTPEIQNAASTQTKNEDAIASVTTLKGLGHFASGSAKLTPAAKKYFQQMAGQYSEAEQIEGLKKVLDQKTDPNEKGISPEEKGRREGAAQADEKRVAELRKEWSELILVFIGHTDDNGDSRANMVLSEARARAVAEVFRTTGIQPNQIFYQGAGASFPIADNRTVVGRAENRRVEIVELPPRSDVSQYLALRQPNPDFYRPLADTTGSTVASKATSSKGTPPTPAKEMAVMRAGDDFNKPDQVHSQTGGEINFGGSIAGASDPELLELMGGVKPERTGNWGFINVAVADETVYQVPCIRDDPARYDSLPIKGLSDDQPIEKYQTGDFMPGLYNTVWADTVNGHYVAFKNMAVTRDGQSVRAAEALVYENYSQKTDISSGDPVRSKTRVSTMAGQDALLYRMYMGTGSNVRCVDLILPYQAPFAAKAGQMYYDYKGTAHKAKIVPKKVSQQ